MSLPGVLAEFRRGVREAGPGGALARAAAAPGADAMAQLADVTGEELDGYEQVEILRAWEAQRSWLEAQVQQALVGVAGVEASSEDDWSCGEVAAALRLSSRTAQSRVDMARFLCGAGRPTLEALSQGRATFPQARVIVDAVEHLDAEVAAAVQERVLPRVHQQTRAQLRATVARAVLAADPLGAEARHAEAMEQRAVRHWPEPDSMATLNAYGRADEVAELYRTVDDHAQKLARVAGVDDRPGKGRIDGLRMDALLALVRAGAAGSGGASAGAPGARCRGEAAVVLDFETLLGLADSPGELPGYGPIVPSLARELAGDREWRRWVADPVEGHLLDFGRSTYRPPARLRQFLAARDRCCRFPGCGQPVHRCDIDHTRPYDNGGATSAANCRSLCRRHHRLKTHGGWRIEPHDDGSCTWTSPAGHAYLVRPPPATPA